MNLGKAIRELRKQQKSTQKEFAAICDITQTYLSQIENNLKEPNISVIKVIAKKLQISVPILFFMSMEEQDLIPDRKLLFHMINPAFKSLVKDFLSTDQR